MKKKNEELTADRPDPAWWPDLTTYHKAMLLHHIPSDEVEIQLKEYAAIWSGKQQIVCDFLYTALPDDPEWIYLEFPNFEKIPHHLNFWHYQNLLIWLSQKADREFCLAIPQNQNAPLFLSTMDRENPYGDSCVGIYADRDFYFEIPSNRLEWGMVPTSAFDYRGFLKETFQFETQWIAKVAGCAWKKTQITLAVSE